MSKYRGFDILPGSYTGWDAVTEGYDASFEDGMWRSNGHLFNAATEAEVKRLVDEHLEEQDYERVECEVCGGSGRVTEQATHSVDSGTKWQRTFTEQISTECDACQGFGSIIVDEVKG